MNIMESKKENKVLMMCLCSLFTALIAVGAFLKIPIPLVPITLQGLFTILAALLLGAKWGTLSVLLYIVIGLLGVPIFTQGGGISYIFIPTFGYLLGYILGTFINAKIVHKTDTPSYLRIFAANFTGVLAVYTVGVPYFFMASELWGNGTTMKILFLNCFLFTIPGDILKCFIGTLLGKRLIPLTAKYRN